MRRSEILLLGLIQACRALQSEFSIHEDVLAHPQFEVVFSDSYIIDKDAHLLLHRHNQQQQQQQQQPDATSEGHSSKTDLTTPAPSSTGESYEENDMGDGSSQVSETFEIMNMPPSRYLCSIPVLAPPTAPNKTATALAKAEEARQLSKASARGSEILNSLEGECMYYVSGWWSYSFCYGREIVQFHAFTNKAGKPVRDPNSQEYILGRMEPNEETARAKNALRERDVQKPLGSVPGGRIAGDSNDGKEQEESGDGLPPPKNDPHNTELQVRGDQRFMVQRLGAGTICDLTNQERTIEIQYHCNPGGANDRINWIKEVTTCSYLMEVRLPRLCEEEAFMPPKPARAHPISCRLIVSEEEAAAAEAAAASNSAKGQKIEAIEGTGSEEGEGTEKDAKQKQQKKQNKQNQQNQGNPTEKGGEQKEQPTDDNHDGNNQAEAAKTAPSVTIGGVVVGARATLGTGEDGRPSYQLEPPRGFAGHHLPRQGKGGQTQKQQQQQQQQQNDVETDDSNVVAVLALGGGKQATEILPDSELRKLDLNPEVIAELCVKLEKISGGRAWKVEALQIPGEPRLEIRAMLDADEDDDENAIHSLQDALTDGMTTATSEDEPWSDPAGSQNEADKDKDGNSNGNGNGNGNGNDDEKEQGSQETFKKDEL